MSPTKIALVAGREFMAAVTNKGFLIGVLIMPVIVAVLVVAMPRLMTASARQPVRGEVAVLDPTGRVTPALRDTLSGAATEARRQRAIARALRDVAGSPGEAAVRSQQDAVRISGATPEFHLVERPATADLAAETLAAELSPIDDVRSTADYRRAVAARVLHRILRDAGGW